MKTLLSTAQAGVYIQNMLTTERALLAWIKSQFDGAGRYARSEFDDASCYEDTRRYPISVEIVTKDQLPSLT